MKRHIRNIGRVNDVCYFWFFLRILCGHPSTSTIHQHSLRTKLRSRREQRLQESLAGCLLDLRLLAGLLALGTFRFDPLLSADLLPLESLCIRVEAEQYELVRERVLVLSPWTLLRL